MAASDPVTHRGGCLCGAVRYRVDGSLRPVIGCHCEQCRRTSGHYVAATQAAIGDLVLDQQDGLRWYESSQGVERGFCVTCGSSLFWQRRDSGRISIMAGTLDTPTGLQLVHHIHTATAGDYYTLDPRIGQSSEQVDVDAVVAATCSRPEPTKLVEPTKPEEIP